MFSGVSQFLSQCLTTSECPLAISAVFQALNLDRELKGPHFDCESTIIRSLVPEVWPGPRREHDPEKHGVRILAG